MARLVVRTNRPVPRSWRGAGAPTLVNLLGPAVVLFVVASFLKISFIYNVAYVLFAVYTLCHLWTWRIAGDVRFRRRFQERALLGDEVVVTLEIENGGWLPIPWLLVSDRLPTALASPPFFRRLVSLQPRQTHRFTYTLHCRQRGWYEIGPLSASLGDVFGLSVRQQDYSAEEHVTVYPRILPLDELGLPSKSPFGHLRSRQPLYEDPARIIGVRPYQSGDSLRRINWKASASAGSLQVRKLEPAMTLETVILLDVNLSEFERLDAYAAAEMGIVVAASLANHLASLRQEVGLLTNGTDPAEPGADPNRLAGYLPRKGRGHLTAVLELLGRLNLAQDRAFWPLVQAELQRLPWGATLVFVVPRETPELLETLLQLKRSGFNVVVVYVDYSHPSLYEPARRRASTLGIPAFRVWRESDLDQWRRQASPREAIGGRATL